ncbi:MAG: rRNA pseudouridine synthase [Kiritimatiellales bacterium]|nr:rRNA pseudouridine synthase [Kiritimatiellales bacterium]
MDSPPPIRLQKYLADCGLGSRRACEKLIVAGDVAIDGHVVKELGTKVDPSVQRVTCNGKPVAKEAPVVLLVNKPVRVICTSQDPQGRPTVLELLSDLPERVYTVGRLDFMSEGLLIVTNDGELAHSLTHPRYHVEKVYRIWINKSLTFQQLEKMKRGLPSEGETLKVLNIEEGSQGRKGFEYTITLGEGRNRHIRRMMDFFDVKIFQLQRISIGPLRLDNLKPGEWRTAKPSELKQLRKLIGEAKKNA